MDDKQRLNLSKMLQEYQTEETTDKIRELKHSKQIKQDVGIMLELKKKYSRMERNNNASFRSMVERKCSFLFNNYTNIFNKLYNDELDLNVLSQFVQILQRIEEGEIDQHEGSYMVGTLLKKLYIDSALKREEKMEKGKKHKKTTYSKSKNISWNEYKKMQED
jgi:hypothetical protein